MKFYRKNCSKCVRRPAEVSRIADMGCAVLRAYFLCVIAHPVPKRTAGILKSGGCIYRKTIKVSRV